jgi:prenyltransferase beta subunit
MNSIRSFSLQFYLIAILLITLSNVRAISQQLFTGQVDLAATEVDRVYVKGLQFLIGSQTERGNWGDRPYGMEPGVVGLALVSILAHGDDPNHGPYALTIEKGINFILGEQNSETGYIGRTMYNHGFATLALAEAYGAVIDDRIGPALESAIELILTSQSNNPHKAWRYSPESTDADTTVSGAQMVALFAARNAGLSVPQEAIEKGIAYFHSCQSTDGGFGYTSSSGPNGPRTAIGCLVLALAKKKETAQFQSAFKFLKRASKSSSYYHYFLYYGSQAFFHASPEEWNAWNHENIQELKQSQNPDGSWDGQFGSTFSTAASLLSLALNYRFLPIYER